MSAQSKSAESEYEHTQKAPLFLLMFAISVVLVVMAWATPLWPLRGLLCGVSVFFVLIGLSFRQLTVRAEGTKLRIAFGPLPIFTRQVSYSDIKAVSPGRTMLIEGWGIHLSPKGGWVWNIWGRDCVDVRFCNGKRLRIGTDDVAGLTQHLRERMKSE